MTEGGYRSRLERDLPAWQERGWVTPDGAAAILGSLAQPRQALRMSGVVALLGAVLLGVGVIGVVAANWEAIPRIVRFATLVALLAASHGAAALLRRRDHLVLAEAALLVAGLVFAGSIALVGQTYHLAGEFSDAVAMWALGCLGAAVLARSAAKTILAAAGGAFWTGLVAVDAAAPHLPSLGLGLGALAVAAWLPSRPARTVAVLGVGFWIAVAVLAAADAHGWRPAGALALLAATALAVWATGTALAGRGERAPRLAALGEDLAAPALPALLLALAFLQVAPKLGQAGAGGPWLPLAALALAAAGVAAVAALGRRTIARHDAVAAAVLGAGALAFALVMDRDGFLTRLLGSVLVLAASLWAVSLGTRGIQPAGRSLGLTAFALEIAYVYVLTFGTVLNTAFALLGGGALFLGVAGALVWIDRRLRARLQPLEGAGA